MIKPILTPAELRKLLRCNPETGKLYWRKRTFEIFSEGNQGAESNCARWNARYADKEAFTAPLRKYRYGRIFRKTYSAHRVIWAMTYGEWPPEQIDHINGIGSDNRIVNLRAVNNAENCKNQTTPKNNTSGVMGVSWHKVTKKWAVQLSVKGKRKTLGYFTEKSEAATARKDAEVKHGYHPNHGRANLVAESLEASNSLRGLP